LAEALQQAGREAPDINVTADALLNALWHCWPKYPHPPDCSRATEILQHNPELVNAHGRNGDTALHVAAGQHLPGTCALLLDMGADVNARNNKGKTALFQATDNQVRELLISRGADVNARDNQGRSPLFEPAELGKSNLVKLLLQNGADINVRDESGMTALQLAIEKKQTEVIKLLQSSSSQEALLSKPAKNNRPTQSDH
jgi:ankyrin repeat protein